MNKISKRGASLRFFLVFGALVCLIASTPAFSASGTPRQLVKPWDGVFDFVPPVNKPIILTQPDGTCFEAYLTGAEIGGKLEHNGYTVIRDVDGYWKYAERTRQGILPGGIVGKDLPPVEKGAGRTQSLWVSAGKDVREQLFTYLYQHNRGSGQQKYVALLMDFTDCSFVHDISYFQKMLSGINTFPSGSLREFYLENSFNTFDPIIDVYGVFHSSHQMSYYSWDSGRYVDDMLEEILPQADAAVNFTKYDNDGDGYVDMVIVIHAGPDAAATANTAEHIWSHASWAYLQTNDGVYIGACNTGPDVDASIGVYVHEMGHSIGEMDFYDTTYKSMGTGDWDVMSGGCWYGNPAGSNPIHFNPYSKIHQGWLTPANISHSQVVGLQPRETAKSLVQINISGTQWFYVEYISKNCGAKFDRLALASGAIIWHLDTYGSQTNPSRYFLDVEEFDGRDGTQELQLNLNRGEPTDLWADDGTGMSDATNPNTSANSPYTKSGIVFANFSKPGITITFEVYFSSGSDIAVEKPLLDELCIYNTTANISAKVYNNAQTAASNVNVSFYAGNISEGNLLGSTTISSISGYGNASATVQAIMPRWGDVEIWVKADIAQSETTKSNNVAKSIWKIYERKGQILIVDDDDGFEFEKTYQGILDFLGYSWNTVVGHATSALMQGYDAVLWQSGSTGRMQGQLSLTDITELKNYLNGGGRVWFSSPRLAGGLGSTSQSQPGVDPGFLRDYLGAVFDHTLQSSGGTVTGTGELMSGLQFNLLPIPGRQMYDVVNPGVSAYGDAIQIFTDGATGKYLGTCVNGSAYGFKTVFTGFNIVQVENTTKGIEVTARILNWFGVSAIKLDRKSYTQLDTVATVTVVDWKKNVDSGTPETVNVILRSTSEMGGEPLVLVETGASTGVFVAQIQLSGTDSQGVLKIAYGDVINATYFDAGANVNRWCLAYVENLDNVAPLIEHTPLTIGYNHTEITVNCFVFDNAAVGNVTLHYRVHGAPGFTPVLMNFSNGTCTAKIPADAVTVAGVDYYIEAVDGNGNSARTEEYYISVIETPVLELNPSFGVLTFLAVLSLWSRRLNLP
ncbi:MAG: M6 family metalloprotease domain-containing protein [Thermoplasmata archaeon]|nr:M6 family metalloprotease domain-containing protein [Thermoplasmata archaeon]